MSNARPTDRLSVLTLRIQVLDDRPDWPVVMVLVDDEDPFGTVAPGWRGFDPDAILGEDSPLLPRDHGRRVAVYTCSCGQAGCGVIAPVIVPSPDGSQVSWVDFRDVVGIFSDPVLDSVVDPVPDKKSKLWDLPDRRFDRERYVAEVRRAARDRSWETPQRRTARLVRERLEPLGPVHPPGLPLRWVQPAWDGDGVLLAFERAGVGAHLRALQRLLRLTSTESEPDSAARDMTERLLATEAEDWTRTFGWHPS